MNEPEVQDTRCWRHVRNGRKVARCKRNGTVQVNGRWWCAQHDPIAEKKRQDEANVRWGARQRAAREVREAQGEVARFMERLATAAVEQVAAEIALHEKLGTPMPDTPMFQAAAGYVKWRDRLKERARVLVEAGEAVRTRGRSQRKET